ncbi:hypothetical protein FNV43_RR17255 [Rhamnella rubrinervis]|uniref:Uncharacterized protein n=1 Tax=Rhamnella rubrinervis TaxID=2594499 RepID=A0A8K0DX69_9ROSA|nr:hypothetical protein FNV43_RR17255 [Rhamnella rubrinervis]
MMSSLQIENKNGTQVRFISTSTIQPKNDRQNHDLTTQRIELTPWDLRLLFFNYSQQGLLFHKPKHLHCEQEEEPKSNIISLIDHLKATLSRTLEIFYPLAGRLVLVENHDKTSSFFLHCNGEGAEFVHAAAHGVTVADVVNTPDVPNHVVDSFFLMNGVLSYQGISKPLLAVQVTELLDGIFISCTMNHSIADGSSFMHFLNTWSDISRNGSCDQLSQPYPVFGRQYLDGIVDLPIHIPFFHDQIPHGRLVSPPLQQRVFRFPKQKVAVLKAKANAEMNTNNISALQALMGHLWISITRNRHLKDDVEVACSMAVSMRQRIQPRLPEEHLGNTVLHGVVRTTAGELLKNGLGWAAWQINKTIASQTPEEAIKFLKDWAKSPKIAKVGQFADGTISHTAGSPRFNVYGNDFGWGRPISIRSGLANKFDGKLMAYPGDEQGCIDFEACLSPETMQAMTEDEEFMKTLSINLTRSSL